VTVAGTCHHPTTVDDLQRMTLLRRRGFVLEYTTLGWNVGGVAVLALALASQDVRSVALIGFALDSLIEIGASTVVIWELSGTEAARRQRALRLIGAAFAALTAYLAIQSTAALISTHRATESSVGIAWTGLTAIVMFGLAAGKARTATALGNPVLRAEGRVTLIDGALALAVLSGLSVDAAFGWWWADPVAGYVLVCYAAREAWHLLRPVAEDT
jgi:divalent metal cation (Fe/Co/Zn/Cd) transporter